MKERLLAGIAGVVLLAAAVAPALADYARGKAAYEAGDFGTALAEWTARARKSTCSTGVVRMMPCPRLKM